MGDFGERTQTNVTTKTTESHPCIYIIFIYCMTSIPLSPTAPWSSRVEIRLAGHPPHESKLLNVQSTQTWKEFCKELEHLVGPIGQVRK